MAALRQAVFLTGMFLVLLIIAGFAALDQFEREFRDQIELELQVRSSQIASAIEEDGFDAADYPLSGIERVLFLSEQFVAKPGFDNDIDLPRNLTQFRDFGRGQWYYYVRNLPDGQLIVGTNLGRRDQFLDILADTLMFIGLSAAGLALLFGLVLGLRTQRRLNKITDTLQDVARGDLTARTQILGRRDDLDMLAHQVDETIAQLESLMHQTREFSASIAHDLKTPLARLRLRLETALTAEIENGDSSEEIGAALEQTDQVISIFDAFLRIAKLKSGNAKAKFETIALEELAREFEEIYQPFVEDNGAKFDVSTRHAVSIKGDRVLLIQMLANLVENAVRYTDRGARISLIASGKQLIIADDGPGIPEEEYEKVLRPLYRLDQSRTSQGAGLGLSLVDSIAQLHGAQVSFSDNPEAQSRGLIVTIDFA